LKDIWVGYEFFWIYTQKLGAVLQVQKTGLFIKMNQGSLLYLGGSRHSLNKE